MADIYLILVYCLIYMGISLIHCDAITLSGIPTVNYGSQQRLTCRQGYWWNKGISDTTFYRDEEKFAKIRRGFWGSCILEWLKYSKDDFETKCSWTTRTLIINNIDDGYNNTIWHCESRGKKSNEYPIKVEDLSPCNLNVSISGNISDIVEGEKLHLTCNHDGDNDGVPKYFWKIFRNNGSTSTNRAQEIKQRASRGDSGMYICRVEGSDCTSEAQLDINVQYHPNVTIQSEPSNSTINMTCLGDGYPHNFTFYGWHHYINGQLVRILEGKETFGSLVLILEGVTVLDNGNYKCFLSNGIPDVGGNLNSSAENTVSLPVAPTEIETEREEIVINKEDGVNLKSVFLVEDVTSVTLIEPSKTHTKLNISDVIKEEFQNIQVYGTTVNLSVIVVQYSIPNVTNEGHYYFNVCNMHQCNVSYGYKITFKSEESLSGKPGAQEQDENLPIIIGAVAGVVVLLVIVIICVVRRRASTSESISKDDQTKNSHPNPTYDDGNIEIIPNELYQSSDAQDNNTKMQIIPNELYVSSGPVQNTDLKNMEIIPNELYVSADADNQSGAQAATGPNTIPLALQNKIEEMVINKEDGVNLTSVFLVEDVTSVTLIEPSKTQTKLNISDVIKEEFQNIKVYGTTVILSVSVVQYSIPNVTNEGHYYFNVCNMHQLWDVSYGYKITFKSEESLPGMNDQKELDQNLPVILGAVAGVVVIIVIVIIIVVVVRRRSSTSDSNNTDYADLDLRHPNPVYTDLQGVT